MISIAFFNNKGGVGKTSLTYHVAWMLAELGVRVLVADLDPQANLTAMLLSDDEVERLWPEGPHPDTVLGALDPILRGVGDIASVQPHPVGERLWLLPGDLGLASFEDKLSETWPKCLGPDEAAFRVQTAFYRVLLRASKVSNADLCIVDVGPNLGAINRSALLASSHVVVPIASDLFSLQGLKNLGPTLRSWRSGWSDRRSKAPAQIRGELPDGSMTPVGYVLMPFRLRLNRPVTAYQKWGERIPLTYLEHVLDQPASAAPTPDPNLIGMMKHYGSLMALAQEARKPVFMLKPADGAMGAHQRAVQQAYAEIQALAREIVSRCGYQMPGPH